VECYASKASPYKNEEPRPILYNDPLEIKGGWIELTDKPGFGMKVDDKIAEKYESK
jgi:L-alanine-DL-glutamate epimerase-like enolase superfamily enzyme